MLFLLIASRIRARFQWPAMITVRFDPLFLISFLAHDLDRNEPRFSQTPSSVCSHFGREIAVDQLYRTMWGLLASFDHRTRTGIKS